MSVFTSGLSRLRNSFRRKSGRFSEGRGRNGSSSSSSTKESTKAARSEKGRPAWKDGSSSSSSGPTSPHSTQATTARSSSPRPVPSQSRARASDLAGREHGDGSSPYRDQPSLPSLGASEGAVLSSPSQNSHDAALFSEGLITKRHYLNDASDVDYDDVAPSWDDGDVSPCADVCDVRSGSGQLGSPHFSGYDDSSRHTSSSSSSPSLPHQRSKSNSGQDMNRSGSTLEVNADPFTLTYNNNNSNNNNNTSHSAVGEGCDGVMETCDTSPDSADAEVVQRKRKANTVTAGVSNGRDDITERTGVNNGRGDIRGSAGVSNGRDDITGRTGVHNGRGDSSDEGSSCGSYKAMVDSDDSGDPLPFTDASDHLQSADHPLPPNHPGHKADHATTDLSSGDLNASQSNQDPASSPTPTLRSRSGHSNRNARVSFGANLQEVLGRAENARKEESSENEPAPASACEIPQTLKESPSLLALHKPPEEDLTCRVCNQLFKHPRILPCLHTFCSSCVAGLQTYPIHNPLDNSSSGSGGGGGGPSQGAKEQDSRDGLSPSPVPDSTSSSSSFSQSSRRSSQFYSVAEDHPAARLDSGRVVLCPTCLKETRVSLTLQELPRNYVVERKVAHYQSTHKGVVRQECDSCGEQGGSCLVTARCMECGENLCSLCELSHRRQKKTRRHQLLDIDITASSPHHRPSQAHHGPKTSNEKKGKSQVTSRAPPCRPVLCIRHAEEELKLFCVTCDLPVCRDCVVMDHRDHDCQFLSKELFQGQMKQMQQMIRSVVPYITAVDQQLKKVADCQEHIQSRAHDVTQEIQTHMDSFLSAIDQHRQQLLQQVGMVVEEKQHALHVTERHLRQVRHDVEHTCRFVSDLIESASDVEILSVKRLVRERLSSLQQVSATPPQPVSSFIKFSPAEAGEVINNFQMFGRVLSRRASAATSILFSEGLSTARVGHESSVVLAVNSEDGAPYTGKDVHIKAWLIFHSQAIRSLAVSVQPQKNGAFSLRFTPDQPGSHFLHVAVHSQPVKDSPFKFKVKSQWREHRGAWQCCTFCSTGGRLDIPCACRGVMPGGQTQGCSHREAGHPGGHHWSCCGKMVKSSECSGMPLPCTSPVRQVTL